MSVNVTLVLFRFLSHLVPWFKGMEREGSRRRSPSWRACVRAVRACARAHPTYGANELHFHFKATSQQQQKLLSSINVIFQEKARQRHTHTHTERNTSSRSDNYSPGCL